MEKENKDINQKEFLSKNGDEFVSIYVSGDDSSKEFGFSLYDGHDKASIWFHLFKSIRETATDEQKIKMIKECEKQVYDEIAKIDKIITKLCFIKEKMFNELPVKLKEYKPRKYKYTSLDELLNEDDEEDDE